MNNKERILLDQLSQREDQMKKSEFKIVHGNRTALELKLLHAIFTPGARKTVASLKKQLASKGRGKLHVVATTPPGQHVQEPKDE
jgi:hypothetical protein